MTVKELAEILKDWPDQDVQVMVAYDTGVRMRVDVVTSFTLDGIERSETACVLTSNDEQEYKEQW